MIFLCAIAVATPHIDEARFLRCVAEVEGHRWSDPGGAYGITQSAWRQHTSLPYRYASIQVYADAWASKHLRWLERSLIAERIAPTAYELAAAWNLGFEGFMDARRHHLIVDYGLRVRNLYHDPLFR